jgi:hypothetical protein
MPLAPLRPALNGALQAYLDQALPRVTKTAAVEAALQLFLEKAGFWPPSNKKG